MLIDWLLRQILRQPDIYLRQVNGVNGGGTVFVRCMSVCVCVSVRSRPVNNSSKTVKATDFKFDVHVSRHSPNMTP